MPSNKNDIPLTDEQSKMMADNLGLIGACLKLHYQFVRRFGYDEAFSFGCLVMVRVCRAFDSTRGTKMSTLFYKAMFMEIRNRMIVRQKRNGKTVSISTSDNREDLFGLETKTRDMDSEIDVREMIAGMTNRRDAHVLSILFGLDGVQKDEETISKEMHTSRAWVNIMKHQGLEAIRRKMWAKYYADS